MTSHVSTSKYVLRLPALTGVAIVLGAHAFVAEAFGFHLVSLRVPGESRVNHRLGEMVLLWIALCSCTGWILQTYVRSPRPDAKVWPLFAFPILACLWLFASNLLARYGAAGEPKVPLPTGKPLVVSLREFFLVANPLLGGAFGCYALCNQCLLWKAGPGLNLRRICRYDLTGNVSGICPECGTPIPETTRDGTTLEPPKE